ncbi:FkbM family methyltransferase [Stutzerimonas nitrititolerans]|uniref:FkbM family methyltransferase n=1 Tax=Stutzerimonas nitrititolerans TaxID=2482751 RepID=UPI0028964CCF|nr:FkbM family methyltransferase [Stutzerimonas nitrititolerans]
MSQIDKSGNMMSTLTRTDATHIEEGKTFAFQLSFDCSLPVRWSLAPLREAQDAVLIDRPERLDVLQRLDDYPHVRGLLEAGCLDYAKQRKVQVRQWLNEGIQVFGAYKVGLKLARLARTSGVAVEGFLDNDRAKQGTSIEGLSVRHPGDVSLENAIVLIASGRHGNAIHAQLSQVPGIRLINMSEFLYALDAPHAADNFSDFIEAPAREPWRFISAFLRMDDERSRQVFNQLMGMRTGLSIALAEQAKSPYDEEYFDAQFVHPVHAARFVDAGAAAGDTLQRLEARFGLVEQAWLFEPELPAYYEALRNFADRSEVWLFNMGLDEASSRATYRSGLSFDIANEMESVVPADITSYIQGVPLDAIVAGKIGLFKLDIEGMEARALRGGREIIARDKPVLAVCAYHRADDYWKLIDEVLSIRPDYRVGIRLYADILEDITLYFY